MQPYFFPYIVYWHLINSVDVFVFYDDVNWINRGWINRNRIIVNSNASYIKVPCLKTSQNLKIAGVAAKQVICLPIYPALENNSLLKIIDVILKNRKSLW